MGKNNRSNYLIDKSFQLGFIFRFVVIIVISIIIVVSIIALYYYVVSNFGEFKLNTALTYTKRGYIKHQGMQVYNYDKEKIEVYAKESPSGIEYICFKVYGDSSEKYKVGDVVTAINVNDIEAKIGPLTKTTTRFKIIVYPLLLAGVVLIILFSLYSLFFSHRMAGPIYRIRVSLDRMLSGDYDFTIRCRKNDFFMNIVERLEKLRQKIVKKK